MEPSAASGCSAVPIGCSGRSDFSDEIGAFHRRALARKLDSTFLGNRLCGEAAAHGTSLAEVLGEGTGVHSTDAWDTTPTEVRVERISGSPVANDRAKLSDDKPAHLWELALFVKGINPVVANFGVSHGDDLATIGGVGENFLVTGHGGIEADLANDRSLSAKSYALENAAIFECKQRRGFTGLLAGIRSHREMQGLSQCALDAADEVCTRANANGFRVDLTVFENEYRGDGVYAELCGQLARMIHIDFRDFQLSGVLVC